MKKTPDTTNAVPSAIDSANFNLCKEADQFKEIKNDLGNLKDTARDCLIFGSINTKVELIEAMRRLHFQEGRDHLQWAALLPLVRVAVEHAFGDAVTNGEIVSCNGGVWPKPRPFELAEIQAAQSTPDCIVEDYLYADVALLPAPGGFGKTTLMLFEAASIAFGSDKLYGKRILKPGPVVIITAEDGREHMAARLREIILDNGMLSQQAKILNSLYVCDVAGLGMRLTAVDKEVVITSASVDGLIRFLLEIMPVLVIFDPAVSFGVGESRVNDAEQALIEVARAIRNSVGCCVRYIHHTGKQNAREGAVDQYAGRGGSAFSDGARMVHVLARVSPADWFNATGSHFNLDDTGLRLVLPKMTYTKPQSDIYIRRSGHRFEFVPTKTNSPQRVEEMIYNLIATDFDKGILRSSKSIEEEDALGSCTRAQRRSAIHNLVAKRRLERRAPPKAKGAAKYLHPLASVITKPEFEDLSRQDNGAEGSSLPPILSTESPIRSSVLIAPPYRTGSGGDIAVATTPPQIRNYAARFGEVRRDGEIGPNIGKKGSQA